MPPLFFNALSHLLCSKNASIIYRALGRDDVLFITEVWVIKTDGFALNQASGNLSTNYVILLKSNSSIIVGSTYTLILYPTSLPAKSKLFFVERPASTLTL